MLLNKIVLSFAFLINVKNIIETFFYRPVRIGYTPI